MVQTLTRYSLPTGSYVGDANFINIIQQASWKACKKKNYKVWASLPPERTYFINKVEQYMFGMQFFQSYMKTGICTTEEMDNFFVYPDSVEILLKKYPSVSKYILNGKYYVKDKMLDFTKTMRSPCEYNGYPVNMNPSVAIFGSCGESWITPLDGFLRDYVMAGTRDRITYPDLLQKLKNYDGCGYIDWFGVEPADLSSSLFALFIPVNCKGKVRTVSGAVADVNVPGVTHGMGDFILCPNINGYPDVSECWVENGAVFARTFDNRGFTDCIDARFAKASDSKPVPFVRP